MHNNKKYETIQLMRLLYICSKEMSICFVRNSKNDEIADFLKIELCRIYKSQITSGSAAQEQGLFRFGFHQIQVLVLLFY